MYPEIFHLSFLHTYGVLVALAFITGVWLAGRLARRTGLDAEAVTNLALCCALAAIAGAKLMMFVVDFRYYSEHPGEIFSLATLQAGGVFYGGLIGALMVAWWYMPRVRLPLATDRRRLCAGHRARPRNRPAGLLFRRLLLGNRMPPRVGRNLH